MNHCGEILLLREWRGLHTRAFHGVSNAAIEIRRGELHRVARYDTKVKAGEPARLPVIPRARFDDDMIVNAVALRLGERAIRDLIHPHGARCRPIQVEGPGAPRPTPVRPHDRIT